jgi:cysteinyl-tRNA synthetase
LIKSDIPAAEKLAVLYKMDDLLGLGLRELEAETVSVPQVVLDLDIERQNARKSKNWAKADEIRDKMQSMGWKVKDTPQGPEFSGC